MLKLLPEYIDVPKDKDPNQYFKDFGFGEVNETTWKRFNYLIEFKEERYKITVL
jgi:hypothetical protein